MFDILIQKRFFPVLLFCFAYGFFSVNSGHISIYMLDEAKNSECAREMLEQKHLFEPTFNYNLRDDKPPLHYYFMMLSYAVFGINEWSARFFSTIFGAMTVVITFIFTARFLNKKTALLASLVLLASPHFNIQSHLAVPDPYLIFFSCWSLLLFYSASTTNRPSHKILMYVAIALAVLSKGPVAIVLPGLIFLLYFLFSGQLNRKTVRQLWPFTGIAIVLAITLPWFIINGIKTDWTWTTDFFLKHNLHRFGSEMQGHGGIFLLTFAYVLIGLLPFSVFFIRASRHIWHDKKNRFILFTATAALTITIFFSISQTKLPNYTVPAYPFFAVLTAYFLDKIISVKTNLKPEFLTLLLVAIAIPVGGYFILHSDKALASGAGVMWWMTIIPAVMVPAFYFLHRKKNEKSLITVGIAFMLLSVLLFIKVFPAIDKNNPVVESLPLIKGKKVAYYKKFNASYSFYLKKKIPGLEENQLAAFFRDNPEGILISIKSEIGKIKLPENCKIIFSGKDLFELPTTVLISKEENSN